jgi:succinate dehydrogenase flavin-adding protein (antitoxin of CptAB toxin-antitoxin module)
MKQEDAKRKIRLLWAERERGTRTNLDVVAFHEFLKQHHPELLEFKRRSKGVDTYQQVKIWLSGYTED